jgi:hypothetical protein
MRFVIAGSIVLLLAGAAAAKTHRPAQPTPERQNPECQMRVQQCISLCVRQNPLNVCRRYCPPDLVCRLWF